MIQFQLKAIAHICLLLLTQSICSLKLRSISMKLSPLSAIESVQQKLQQAMMPLSMSSMQAFNNVDSIAKHTKNSIVNTTLVSYGYPDDSGSVRTVDFNVIEAKPNTLLSRLKSVFIGRNASENLDSNTDIRFLGRNSKSNGKIHYSILQVLFSRKASILQPVQLVVRRTLLNLVDNVQNTQASSRGWAQSVSNDTVSVTSPLKIRDMLRSNPKLGIRQESNYELNEDRRTGVFVRVANILGTIKGRFRLGFGSSQVEITASRKPNAADERIDREIRNFKTKSSESFSSGLEPSMEDSNPVLSILSAVGNVVLNRTKIIARDVGDGVASLAASTATAIVAATASTSSSVSTITVPVTISGQRQTDEFESNANASPIDSTVQFISSGFSAIYNVIKFIGFNETSTVTNSIELNNVKVESYDGSSPNLPIDSNALTDKAIGSVVASMMADEHDHVSSSVRSEWPTGSRIILTLKRLFPLSSAVIGFVPNLINSFMTEAGQTVETPVQSHESTLSSQVQSQFQQQLPEDEVYSEYIDNTVGQSTNNGIGRQVLSSINGITSRLWKYNIAITPDAVPVALMTADTSSGQLFTPGKSRSVTGKQLLAVLPTITSTITNDNSDSVTARDYPPASITPSLSSIDTTWTDITKATVIPPKLADGYTRDNTFAMPERAMQLKSNPINFPNPPTRYDFASINRILVETGLSAALSTKCETDARDVLRQVGLKPLLTALLNPGENMNLRDDAVKGICLLMKQDTSVAGEVAKVPGVINVLCDMMEAPLKGFLVSFRSGPERDREARAQYEATALIKRMVRSNDTAVEIMRTDTRLRKVLSSIIAQGELAASGAVKNIVSSVNTGTFATRQSPIINIVNSLINSSNYTATLNEFKRQKMMGKSSIPELVELVNLTTHEMARVAAWGLGGVPWKPKQPGQKGLRILSFDGGGTRGVMGIVLLKELMRRSGKSSPFELFDIICGTSTGGIMAGLLGILRVNIFEAEALYDLLIDKVFGTKSNLMLLQERAAYDEVEFEQILKLLVGDALMLDSNVMEAQPRVFFVSTKVRNNQPQIQLWRNYNYPPPSQDADSRAGSSNVGSRYNGAFRVNTRLAVRATTAAPTFFRPVLFEGSLYCDGALVANNPSAIALQEAKSIYPNIPVELVVSIGNGIVTANNTESVQSMGWDVLVNQLIATSTDTEDVHSLLLDFLPSDKYFRLNNKLTENLGNMAIDEKNKSTLSELKRLAEKTWVEIDSGPDAKRFEMLVKTLRGPSPK